MNQEPQSNAWILGTILRLVVLSVVVGIVLATLGITPQNFFERIYLLVRHIYDLGYDAFGWLFNYFLLGAMVVVPVWLIAWALGFGRHRAG